MRSNTLSFIKSSKVSEDILAAVICSLMSPVCASVTFYHSLRHGADYRIENVPLL